MLAFLTLLLVLQLAGEVIARSLGLPLPGPVIGMALLFFGLLLRDLLGADTVVPQDLENTAGGLLQHLSLLFVPAGVGIVLYVPLIVSEWPAILTALLGSTVITIAVTALVMRFLLRLMGGTREGDERSGS